MSFLNLEEQRSNMRSSVIDALKGAFPIRGTSRSLFIDKAWIPEHQDPLDFAGQKKAKLSGKSFADPVFASLKLVDNRTGDVLDQEDKVKLGELPIMTPRGSFIVKGNEYQVTNQLRLKPGVYTQYGSDGVLSSQVNLAKGRGFKVWLDQSKGVFNVGIGTSNIKLYPILKDLGVSDGELAKSWGQDLLEANRAAAKGVMDSEIQKLHKNLFYRETGEDRTQAIANVKEYFSNSTAIDRENTKFTLGGEHDRVSPRLFVDVSKKLLGVSRDEVPEDDRNHMAFKSMHAVDDFLKERLAKTANRTKYEIERGLNKPARTKIAEMISKDTFGKNIETLFTRTQLSNSAEQINPLHMVAGLQKITVLGEGGISDRAITPEARGVHPSHLGMLDPLQTPESSGAVGAMFRLPMGARKDGNELKVVVYDAATGKREQISAREASEKIVAFPGQYSLDKSGKMRPLSDTVTVRNGDTTQEVPASKVEKILPTPATMFGVSVNMMPFLDSTQGNRAVTASRMQEQALPLKHREEPLVQVSSAKGRASFDEQLASQFSFNHLSPTDGKVKKIDPDGVIHIAGYDGKTHKVSTYQDFPLNSGHFLNSIVHVKPGDAVKAKQVIGDTNFTKNGKLALGVNLTTAYLPYRGYNFEDGLVISESASKKMTSLHMYKESVEANPGTIISKDKLRARFPSEYTSEQLSKMDEDGVVKVGETVEEGDPLILVLTENTARPEDGILKDINKSLVKPYSNASVVWSKSVRGVVKNVSKHGNVYDVYVETEEPAVVGDKLAGRHGNKGIISKILSDADMPKTGDDKPVDILMNPHGVPSRINLGQILETAVGKVAFKNGKPIVITNFERDSNIDRVKKMLADNGLKDTETLYDGADGKPLGEVAVGKQFIMKLDHNVAKKFSARDTGGYTADDIPGKGDHEGAQSVDPLLFYSVISHGAKANLHEMATVKSTRNDEFWRAYQLGQRLPAPKPTFAFEKFTSLMKGLGVDVVKKGNSLSLLPMTDSDVEKLSEGEITEPKLYKVVGTNDVKEEKNGFFDPKLTGGNSGNKWTHMTLHEPMPNPIFEDAIKTVLGLKKTEFEDVLAGSKGLSSAGEIIAHDAPGALTGGSAFKRALGNISVADRIKTLRKDAVGTTGQKLNTFNKEIRYLEALQRNKLDPSVYVVSKIPVIPPKFRPIYQLPNGTLMTSDVNMFYKSTMAASQALKDHKDLGLPQKEVGEIRKNLYNEYKAMAGLGGESAAAQGARSPKGIIDIISGTNPKSGFFQHRLMGKRQDLSGRSTVINEPNMGVDEIGIPKKMLQTLYRKPVVKRLVSLGYTPLQAQKEIDKDSPIAAKALELEAENRPIMLNRAPSLTRYSMQAFRPRLTDGDAIKFHPLPMKGLGMDVDGDDQQNVILTFLSPEAILNVEATNGQRFLKERSVSARFKTKIPALVGASSVYAFNLEDFPHGKLTKEVDGKRGKILFYEAIAGTQVLALNEATGTVQWADVSSWSVHPDREVEIVTLRSGSQIITDDDDRAVYGVSPESMRFVRATPATAAAIGMLVPRCVSMDIPVSIDHVCPEKVETGTNSLHLKEKIQLDRDFGYFVGAMVGNGWVQDDKQVGFSATTKEVFSRVEELYHLTLGAGGKAFYGSTDGEFGPGRSFRYSCKEAAAFLGPMIGSGSRSKHLPAFFLSSPRGFKSGLLAGLMDTDGSIYAGRSRCGRRQFTAVYATSSLRLAQEVKLLASSMGIKSKVQASETPLGKDFWHVYLCRNDVVNVWKGSGMRHPAKLADLHKMDGVEVTEAPRMDVVPMPRTVLDGLRSAGKISQGVPSALRAAISRARRCGSISRQAAQRLVAHVGRRCVQDVQDGDAWLSVVSATDVTWDPIESVEKTGVRETGYDLTVPGYETFMAVDGIILSNTVALHVPVSDEAVREAHKMLPTQNLFNPGSGDMMLVPSQDSLLGLYKLTEPGKELRKSFKDFGEAHAAVTSGKISANDIVKIGDKKTSVGRYTVNALLPSGLQDYGMTLDKKRLSKLLGDTARVDPANFGKVIDGLKDLGNEHAYRTGSTISLEDVSPQTAARDKIFGSIAPQVRAIDAKLGVTKSDVERRKLLDAKVKLYAGITPAVEDAARGINKGSNLFKMMASGARGNLAQVRQITVAPVMVNDTKGRPVPTPIKSSYAEGLTPAEYFIQSYGARMGTVDRSQQTSVPGYFAKRLINSMIGITVTQQDCGTSDGVDVSLSAAGDEPKDAMDRYTAETKHGVQKNTLVTAQVIDAYTRGGAHEIKVRSPMTCEAREGVCSKCFGKREHGGDSGIGDNLGVMSAQAITEPGTQLSMQSFHTGGVASGGIGANLKTGFSRILQMTELPSTIRGSATLSEVDGNVRSIDVAPAGGWHVLVEGEEHYVPATNKVIVQVGDRVSKGQRLSNGDENPHEILRLRGVKDTQKFLAREIRAEYKNQGINLRPSIVETAVRQLTNLTRVTDPGSSDYAPGDYAPLSKVNAEIRGGANIQHEPELKGINQQPLFGNEDWLSQLNFQNLKRTIVNASSKGWSSSIHGTNPIAAWVYGAEFGKSKEPGRY